jgi:hypothetical protein
MYGAKLTSAYGITEGRRRDVIGKIDTAPIGNLILNPGKCLAPEGQESKGYEPTGHVVMLPSESLAFTAEVLETLIAHDNNADLLRACGTVVEVQLLIDRLKEKADELEVAEIDAGRDEEVKSDGTLQ